MLHRYLGTEPHKKKVSTDPIITNKVYDATKIRRKIVPSWKAEYPWLVVSDTEEVSLNDSDLPILLIHNKQHSVFPKIDDIHRTTPEMISLFY